MDLFLCPWRASDGIAGLRQSRRELFDPTTYQWLVLEILLARFVTNLFDDPIDLPLSPPLLIVWIKNHFFALMLCRIV